MKLRPYQEAAAERCLASIAVKRRSVLVIPTGGGKTAVAVEIIRRLGRPALFLAHRRELVHQAAQHLNRLGLAASVILAGTRPRAGALAHVASIQTLLRREAPPAELIVYDEVHHVLARTFRSLLDRYPAVPVLGLTATPYRGDGRGLGSVFEEIIVGAYADELIRDGYLVEPAVYAPEIPDLEGVRLVHGDFDLAETARRMGKKKLIGDAVQHYLRHGSERALYYTVNVEHSRTVREAFRAAGIRAEHVDGTTPTAQRDAVFHRLRIGYTRVITQCELATEGFDLPELDLVGILRPTASLGLHLQICGRVLRPAAGKPGCVILDHAGNHHRHGPVTQRVDYTLEDRPVRASNREGIVPSKRCPQCFLVLAPHIQTCPGCGHVFRGDVPETAPGELVRFGSGVSRAATLDDVLGAYDRLEERRRQSGRPERWVFEMLRERFGHAMVREMLESIRRRRGYAPGWVSHRIREVLG